MFNFLKALWDLASGEFYFYLWSSIFRCVCPDYWHSSFTRIRNEKVKVKYDPFDITVAYAYVKSEWVKCCSRYSRELEGHSERELMIAAAELKKLNKLQNKQFTDITGKKLAEFFSRIEMEESALTPLWREAKKTVQKQHLKDTELKQVHAQIEGESLELDMNNDKLSGEIEVSVEIENLTASAIKVSALDVDEDEDNDEAFEPLEEW